MKIHYLPHDQIDFSRWDTCLEEADNSLPYAYSWYLEIVGERRWDGLVLDDYKAIMPLVWNKKLFGLSQLYQPLVSQQHGVFGRDLSAATVEAFLVNIPKHFRRIRLTLNEDFPRGIFIKMPEISQVRNLVLSLKLPYEQVCTAYSKSLQKRLKKSRSNLKLEEGVAVDFLVAYYREQMKGKIELNDASWKMILDLFIEVIARGIGKVYQVLDEKREVLASGIFLFHKKRIINVFAASNVEGKDRFAMHFLLDQIIQQYAGKMQLFDFEGSEIPGVAAFFESFGATERWYYKYEVDRLPFWAQFALKVKNSFA